MLGRLVQKRAWRVNYTRKVVGVVVFFAPILAMYSATYLAVVAKSACISPQVAMQTLLLVLLVPPLVSLACTLLFVRALRERIPFLDTAFAAIDRPEDRPHSLSWLVTSQIATMFAFVAGAIVMFVVLSLTKRGYGEPFMPIGFAFMIATIVSGLGDALAEPVGILFGRRKYATTALFTDRLYERSYMGSLCVFLSAVGAILLYVAYNEAPLPVVLMALAIIPPIMTVAEAKSPHTWDQPIIFLAAFGSTILFALACTGFGLPLPRAWGW